MSCARRRLSNTRSKSDPPKAQSFGGSALSCTPAAAPAFFRICAGSSPRLGGLAGLNNRVTTVNCYAFGSVTANSASNHFGGFIGQAVGIHVNTAAGNFIPALSAQESGRPCFPRRRAIPKYKYPLKTGTAWGGALISRGDFAIMGKNIFRTEAEGGLSMKITVIGCGRWGSLITWYLDRIGHEVTLYGRAGSARMQRFLQTRKNDLLELPPSIALTTDLRAAQEAEVIIISIGSQGCSGSCGRWGCAVRRSFCA